MGLPNGLHAVCLCSWSDRRVIVEPGEVGPVIRSSLACSVSRPRAYGTPDGVCCSWAVRPGRARSVHAAGRSPSLPAARDGRTAGASSKTSRHGREVGREANRSDRCWPKQSSWRPVVVVQHTAVYGYVDSPGVRLRGPARAWSAKQNNRQDSGTSSSWPSRWTGRFLRRSTSAASEGASAPAPSKLAGENFWLRWLFRIAHRSAGM